MAIEPVKKVTIISPVTSGKRLMRTLSSLGAIDVINAKEEIKTSAGPIRPAFSSTEEADERLRKVDFILNLLNTHAPQEQGFFEGLAPVPQVVREEEISEAVQQYDLEGRYRTANDLDETFRRLERARGEALNELQELEHFSDLTFNVKDFHEPKRIRFIFGFIPVQNIHVLDGSAEPWSRFAWKRVDPLPSASESQGRDPHWTEPSRRARDRLRILCACLSEDYKEVFTSLSGIGFEEVQLPRLTGTAPDHILELKADIAELELRIRETKVQIRALAQERRTLVTLKAFWLAAKKRGIAAGKALEGKWVRLLWGYITVKDIPRLESALKKEFPECYLLLEDPGPDEDVPVSLSLPHVFRPLSLLVEMFGLPNYRAFDPTPFLNFNFYLFFGICFSDVGYGVLLVLLASYLSKRTRPYEGVNNFARILLYSGISTIICGAFLGSWFGDLYEPKYLGEDNALLWLQSKFVVLDPMNKTIVALLLALGIGVLNQFYGISLKMYGALKRGDWKTAVFDGLFWLLLLPGLLIMVSKLFVSTPPYIFNIGMWLFGSAALGLVLSQGRNLKNPFGKILGGLVSLYGIVGSYGITAFIGDTLSYCRLLALGLTTSIVGMTFNMLGGIVRDVPVVGFFLFVAVIVVGHLFNFAISLLGAFVHSMRLVFVEFFGRFYEGGSRPFEPLGFDSPLCILRKTPREKVKG